MKNRSVPAILSAVLLYCALPVSGAPWRSNSSVSPELIPQPVHRELSNGAFELGAGTTIATEGNVEFELHRYLEGYLYRSVTGMWHHTIPGTSNTIRLVSPSGAGLPPEGYVLTVKPDTITIEANDRGGLFNGIQTFLQLLPPEIYAGKEIPQPYAIACQAIKDHPKFGYRGLMLDVARTFSDKETVLKLIDRMAHHKLNRFHWHLTDDEGWRVEIKSYPELAKTGGFRGGESPVQPIYGEWDKKYGGYFTQDDIRDIVAYAAFRNIEIIPEIDLPGHSRCTAKVYPSILCGVKNNIPASKSDRRNVWCASKEANYEMLDKIIAELAALFPSKYFHIGGDEVLLGQWKGCPDCRKLIHKEGYKDARELEVYFADRMAAILEKYGKTPVVWNEVVKNGKFDKNTLVTSWEGVAQCLKTTKDGYKTIIMPGAYFYLDMRQSADENGMTWAALVDTERLYSFGFAKTGFGEEHMKNVEGVEASFFSELLLSNGAGFLDYQLYPRVCALAEVAWRDESERDWNDFYSRLTGSHLDRLGAMGITFRQFPPEVNYSEGVITATVPFAGAEIRYTNDGTEPESGSALYTVPIKNGEPENYRFRAFYGGAASPSVTPSSKARFRIAANAAATFEIPLSDVIDSDGLWYFHWQVTDSNIKVNKISVRTEDKTANIVGYAHNVNQTHRMRLYADNANRAGTMTVSVNNLNAFDCDIALVFERSPYIEPEVKFRSSLNQNSRFPFKNIEDYNFTTYARTTASCKKDDHFTFTFEEPVDAYSIEVATGLSYMPRFHVMDGHVEISVDGEKFTGAGKLIAGRAVIYPHGIVKAVRIVSDMDGNSENAVALQDLKIKPRRK